MLAIWKRELQNYYLTPIGYVFMGIFLLVGGVMFYLGNIMGMTPSAATLLGNLNYIFMLTVPILTMRLLSEERRTKTDQLLITSPLRIWDIVGGKFLAAATVVLLTTCCTLLYIALLSRYTDVSRGDRLQLSGLPAAEPLLRGAGAADERADGKPGVRRGADARRQHPAADSGKRFFLLFLRAAGGAVLPAAGAVLVQPVFQV